MVETPKVCSPTDLSMEIGTSDNRWSQVWPVLRTVLTLIFFFAVFWLLHHEFKALDLRDVSSSFRSIPLTAVFLAVLLTIANYSVMSGYDLVAMQLVSHQIPRQRIVTASLLSYAVTNLMGTVLGGTPVRFRLYSACGLSVADIIRLIFYIGVAFWMGLATLGGTLFVAAPFEIPARFNLPLATSRPLGILMLSMAVIFFLICAVRKKPLHFMSVNFQPPPVGIATAQTLIAAVDFLLASATLYVLLPSDLQLGFLPFTAIFLLAIFVAMMSHVPGGLGVLELVLVTMLPKSSHSLVASLLAFRVIYYLLPFLVAVLAIAISSVREHRHRVIAIGTVSSHWARAIAPKFMTAAVFVAGLILLISGSLPAEQGRMLTVRRFVPLPIVEVSHFIGSVAGGLLIVLAHGLYRRIDAAWTLTVGLLAVGILASLTKGFDYEEAAILSLILLAMLPCRSHYFRPGRLLAASLSGSWIAAVVLSLGLIVWLILFAYRHVEYSDQLWWDFAWHGDAPRALRGLVGASVVIVLFAVFRLLHPVAAAPEFPDQNQQARAASIVKTSELTCANLALLGDKRLIWSDDERAFVMFGCQGKSWIAMGDPVGSETSADDAAWKFREACDVAGTWPVFYQVDEQSLSRYVDMGLSMMKLGEEARVPLKEFSLANSSNKDLRRTNKKAVEEGLRFEIVPQIKVAALLPQLKLISDAWLSEKSAAEKGFSLGFFHEEYLLQCDIALIFNQETPIAFANLWKGAGQHELSIDLMRYLPDASRSVMEFLFIQLMLWGKQEGYAWFNLGMAPLSGIDSHRLGPLWNRVSSLMFRHGEHFYNFQGLRNYKSKFNPVWTPKYLASPGGLATARVLADVSTLIAGGVRRLLRRPA